MDFLQVIFKDVEDVLSGVLRQVDVVKQSGNTIVQGYVPKVQAAWIGRDADEFANDVKRKLEPAIFEVIGALTGLWNNVNSGRGIVKQADQQVKKLAEQYDGVVEKIC